MIATTTTTVKVTAYRATSADKADFLSGKKSERADAATVATILEVASNYAVGHPTYKKLIDAGQANPACPLQTALTKVTAKTKACVTYAFTEAKVQRAEAHTQATHNEWIDVLRVQLLGLLAPAPRAPRAPAKADDCAAQLAALQSEHAALCEAYMKATGHAWSFTPQA